MKKVYIAMAADIIHHGHMKIIEEGKKYGEIIIGLLTDEVIASYKRMPLLNFEQRKSIMENIKGVSKVVVQETLDYSDNLRKYKPDYVVHGDDWKTGIQREIRKSTLDVLREWGGELVEVPYTKEVSISKLDKLLNEIGTTPEDRKRKFKSMLALKPLLRVMEAHNGISGLIVNNTKIVKENKIKAFDAIWISSLCDSTAKGKPDTELVDFTSRLTTINDIIDVSSKPIIFDGDTGGQAEHFGFMVKTLDRLGISAVVIEDKIGLKKNSLLGDEILQTQDSIESFSRKIKSGIQNKISNDFMIIARIESLILNAGMEDALLRAKAYIAAGVDGVLIHSKSTTANEILAFCKRYGKIQNKVPLIVVPTTYCEITETELEKAGVQVVIYANHLLRSAYPAMVQTATSILENERAFESSNNCLSINEMLNLFSGEL